MCKTNSIPPLIRSLENYRVKRTRVFRGPESIAAEALSREAIAPFLNDRGYTVIADERIPRATLFSSSFPSKLPMAGN
ncbi:hypothetical protein SAMN04488483_3240 [Pseudomonas helmanticensis]|uniref:Uncharacterized protein n=1 Tax=Pseudomonas helmanticensis TaxID=1471381 RepID=A0ACD2U7D4_9PSED|nr:hypothetical protein SAMN04488483_3240 [Pseudomonas helmanticensis]